MNGSLLKQRIETSPAFVLDEDQVIANLKPLQALRQATGCKILYSMKALPLASLLALLRTEVDGISVSSLFEARLAKEIFADHGSIHFTTPGMRADEFAELAGICSHISFNSLSQYQRLRDLSAGYSKGLRINPKLSFVGDERYDPCRRHSKLGVDVDLLTRPLNTVRPEFVEGHTKSGFDKLGPNGIPVINRAGLIIQDGLPEDVEGLHFHTVFGFESFLPLQQTLTRLLPVIESQPKLKWLNLGGGYLYNRIADQRPLIELLTNLKQRFGLEIYLEPGKAIVGDAGFLLTTVLDRFISDGKSVLVLDTSVNHNPEVFEYQIKPILLEEDGSGDESAILVGSTCLAGDLFGEYRFNRLPEVGDKLVFSNVGAYSLIKASRFNGYNLPDIYAIRAGCVGLRKSYNYEDFRQQWL